MTIPVTLTREVSKIVADILADELTLDEAHCLLGNQKWDIPADQALFVVVFDQAAPVIGATAYLETDDTSPNVGLQIQQATMMHDVRVEIMSYDASARLRKEEVVMALCSFAAQQAGELYGIQIGRPGQPVDASDTEVTGRLQRFVIHVNVTALHQKVKQPAAAGYFDKFNGATAPGTAKAPEIAIQE